MKTRWFVRSDLDGFFGLFVDNLLQLMLIVTLSPVCGFPMEMVIGKILPGAAISILVGNLFYAWQAKRLAEKTGRDDVTALPYGINTVSLLAFIFLIMGPIYRETNNSKLAWQAGLFAAFLSGVFEIVGAYFGDFLRRHTPRAALLSALAGIAITFIAMGFIFQIFASPAIALVPMFLILMQYASGTKLPGGIPGGFLSILLGIALAWGLQALGWISLHLPEQKYIPGPHFPTPVPQDLFALFTSPLGWKYFAVIFPMSLFNIIGSLQNLESAEAAGDKFDTRFSLLANGIAGLAAPLFGSAFPTTIYIGHPGWKAMGARVGYSIINGVIITLLCLFGGVTLILKVVPIEVTLGILLWIGIIITAQAFQEIPKKHALAVAMGLIPSLAAWALFLIETSLRVAGTSLFDAASKFGNTIFINGVFGLNQGFLISSMVLAAILVFIIERQFFKAGVWTLIAAFLSALGLIHAYTLTPMGVENKFGFYLQNKSVFLAAPEFTAAYAVTALALFVLHAWTKNAKN